MTTLKQGRKVIALARSNREDAFVDMIHVRLGVYVAITRRSGTGNFQRPVAMTFDPTSSLNASLAVALHLRNRTCCSPSRIPFVYHEDASDEMIQMAVGHGVVTSEAVDTCRLFQTDPEFRASVLGSSDHFSMRGNHWNRALATSDQERPRLRRTGKQDYKNGSEAKDLIALTHRE